MATKLLEVARELLVAEREDEVHETVARALAELTDADGWASAVYEDGRLVCEAGSPTSVLDDLKRQRLTGPTGVVRQAFATGTPCVVDDLGDVRSVAQAAPEGERQYRSLLCVPCHRGVLLAAGHHRGQFDAESRATVEELAALASAALERLSSPERPDQSDEHEQLETAATVFSHDVSNALQIVRTYLDLARRETDDPGHIDKATSAAEYVTELVDDMVYLLRTGNRITSPEVVDLRTVTTRAWQRTRSTRATLEVESTARLEAHESSLCQLLENLLRNAVEHGSTSLPSHTQEDAGRASSSEPSLAGAPEDAVEHSSTSHADADASADTVEHSSTNVSIRVGATENGFYVEDDGPGVPADEREDIFEVGYSTADSGTGFGLGICREIAHSHGWEITVTDGRDGGARFEITGVTFEP